MSTVYAAGELTDAGYEIADRIDLWLEKHPGAYYSPSRIAAGVKCRTHEARDILQWLDRTVLVAADGNGAWRKYAARL